VQEGKRGKVFLHRAKHEKTVGSDMDDEVLDLGEELHLVGGGGGGGGGMGEKRMGRVKW